MRFIFDDHLLDPFVIFVTNVVFSFKIFPEFFNKNVHILKIQDPLDKLHQKQHLFVKQYLPKHPFDFAPLKTPRSQKLLLQPGDR